MSEVKTEIWYLVFNDGIWAEEVVNHNDLFVKVMVKFRDKNHLALRAKSSSEWNYFPAWQEAHTFLAERALKRVQSAENELQAARANLEVVQALQEPQDGVK